VSLLELLRSALTELAGRHRRRLQSLTPALERRRPRIAAEDYAARHSIEHTVDRKAELRRLAPTKPEAARRYRQLLLWEIEGLRQMVSVLRGTTGGRDLPECIAEAREEIDRLETEISWCTALLDQRPNAPTA
jgi:hypothetical protein